VVAHWVTEENDAMSFLLQNEQLHVQLHMQLPCHYYTEFYFWKTWPFETNISASELLAVGGVSNGQYKLTRTYVCDYTCYNNFFKTDRRKWIK